MNTRRDFLSVIIDGSAILNTLSNSRHEKEQSNE
jgi:hypothetical protein